MHTKICPYCGAKIEADSRFCLYCMTSLEAKTTIKHHKNSQSLWPYITIAVMLIFVIVLSVSFPFIKDKFQKREPEESQSVAENKSSSPNYSSSITSSSSEGVTTQTSTIGSNNSDSAENKNDKVSSKTNNSSSKTSQSSSQNSRGGTSPKPSISDYLYFREHKFGGGYIIDGYKEGIAEKVIIPNTYKGLPVRIISAMSFVECAISYLHIPKNIEYIGDNAFERCPLSEVQFSDGLKKILCGAFVECVNLKAVTLPDSLLILESFAFQSCKNLTSVSIGKNTTEIGQDCFADCGKLKHVYYRGTESDREKLIISSGNEQLLSATWHYES